MTQVERVLARLRQGPLAAVDFQPPGIVDGGSPIWRVAARIDNLKARGCVIRSERLADGTAVYHLVSEPGVERVDSPASGAASPPSNAASAVGSLSAEPAEMPLSARAPAMARESTTSSEDSPRPVVGDGSLFDVDEFVYQRSWEDTAT